MTKAAPEASSAPRSRLPRWLIILAVVVIVLVIAVFVGVKMLVDPEMYRDRIEVALEQATGWRAELETIDLSLGLSGAALSVSPATLSAPGEESSSFQIDTLSVHAALIPLFGGKLEIESFELVSPSIVLVRPSAGEGWIVPRLGEDATGQEATGPRAVPQAGRGLEVLRAAHGPVPHPDGAEVRRVQEGGGSPSRAEPGGGFSVIIDRVRISDGTLRLIDRTFADPRELVLSDLQAAGSLVSGQLDGTARLAEAPVEFGGRVPDDLTINVEDLPTEAFAIAPGGDMVLPGGSVSGEIHVRWPDAIEADLTARGLTMLAGSQPLEQAEARFVVRPGRGGTGVGVRPAGGEPRAWLVSSPRAVPAKATSSGWVMEELAVRAGEAVLRGGGTLTPALALDMSVEEAPIEDAVRALRAMAPVPVEILGPGAASARIDVSRPSAGDEVDVRVEGTADAGELRIGGPLPAARDVQANFRIRGTDRMQVDIEQGTVANGPIRGQLRVEPLAPPGQLSFQGNIEKATFGKLLTGFAGDKLARIAGVTDVTADVGLDLSGDTIDPLAMTGDLSLEALDVALPGWDLEGALRSKLADRLGELGGIAALLGGGSKKEGRDSSDETRGSSTAKTLLERVTGSVRLQGEKWKLDPVKLVDGDVSATGQGDFLPKSAEMALRLQAHLDAAATKKLVSEQRALRHMVDDRGRLTFPLEVNGPITSPKFGIDLGELAPEDEIKDKLKGAVKDLFD
jgi:hypothetical protein